MKTKPSQFITAALAAVLISPAFALEAPEDDAPPPPAVEKESGLPVIKLPAAPKAAGKAEVETAFLGVVSSDIPDMLADHLDLKKGEGIVIRSLVPEGPAAQSGVAVNDVILKVAGNAVGSPAEITNEILSHKPGEKITLDIIHKGKPSTMEVTLGIKPAEMANATSRTLDQLDLEGLPKELADRVRDALADNVGGLDLGADPAQIPPQMDQAILDLQKRMQGAIAQGFALPGNNAGGKLRSHGEATVKMKDNEGSVEVKSKDGAKEVTVRDQQDKVIWNGPWDTAQDKAAAPDQVRQRVDGLNLDTNFKGNGLRLQMKQAAPPQEGRD